MLYENSRRSARPPPGRGIDTRNEMQTKLKARAIPEYLAFCAAWSTTGTAAMTKEAQAGMLHDIGTSAPQTV
jgi:hypothetical protein